MTTQSLDLITRLRDELSEIWTRANSDGDFGTAFERAKRWHERAVRQLEQQVSEPESKRLKRTKLTSFQMNNPMGNLQRLLKLYDTVLVGLAEEIERDPEFLATDSAVAAREPSASVRQEINPRKVFLVHGHDEANTLKLQAMLRDRFKLEPVVMSRAAGKGRTLIEKFEQLATECAFAFVLLTPDDDVSAGGGEYTQARPNVTFELGWFYGRLGRERVVMLLKEGTKIHSDLDGVSRIQFIRSVEEKIVEIERELSAADIPVAAI